MPYQTPDAKADRARYRNEFALRLISAMDAAGLSQADLAEATGIPQPNLSAMMSGKQGTNTSRVVALARALHVDPRELMPVFDPDEPAPPTAGVGARLTEGPNPDPASGRRLVGEVGPPASSRRRRSAALDRYLETVAETATVEELKALEEIEPLTLLRMPKDEAFFKRWHAFIKTELVLREEIRRKAELAAAEKAVAEGKEGGRRGHPRLGAEAARVGAEGDRKRAQRG